MRGRHKQLGSVFAEAAVRLQQFGALHLHQAQQGEKRFVSRVISFFDKKKKKINASISLFQIYGWVPEYYNDTENLPAEMPASLVTYIKTVDTSWVS